MSQISFITNLLGEELCSNCENERIKTEDMCGPGKVIGLYFSAHWCPPCRAFTPDLINFYNNFNSSIKKGSFSIVFVSSDEDEEKFEEYFKDMPWHAVPFGEKERKTDLFRLFRVHSIPTLVLLDGASGEVITTHGRDCVSDDPKGDGFPWRPRDPKQVLRELTLLTPEGKTIKFEALSGFVKGLYFSAHWCPPCKAFTPQLAATYQKLHESGKKFEVIFVSSDRSEDSFQQYFSTMPWLAIPYGDEKRRKELAVLYGVGGIPTLVLIDEVNNLISKEGRTEINEDPEGMEFPWRPKPVEELTEKHASCLNEGPCVIMFTEGDESDLEAAYQLMLPTAEEYASNENGARNTGQASSLKFFYGGDADICESLREFAQLGDQVPQLVITNIPEGKKYVLEEDQEITASAIQTFVSQFLDGKLTSSTLRT
ncbi:nucleoredoxin-like isoform X1 [Tachypleus tridentatus]|uniref:nucleoredoxin-like isoform X1 n=1 Tax=Tachypleus tridentatus TaxID=6853 RepID=UPI003FD5D34A